MFQERPATHDNIDNRQKIRNLFDVKSHLSYNQRLQYPQKSETETKNRNEVDYTPKTCFFRLDDKHRTLLMR